MAGLDDAKNHCQGPHEHTMAGLDNAVMMLGGFLGAADHAVNNEMGLEATDSSYSDFHQLGATPDSVHHAHNMQHSDIAMRAISEMLGFSHSMIPAGGAQDQGSTLQVHSTG
mmetsp:Transcript_6175/g.16146  ORF Transcript_6175/g.16146 Transcript_6175/m.16146 type:complete len:112 (-) Transcript_6175:213-548(-)